MASESIRGRGIAENPPHRFATMWVEAEPGPAQAGPATEYLEDSTQTILARNQSPDIGFDTSINPYRGCEHGCSYCYARPSHEFLGYSAGLDFESKILVKTKAAELLRKELSKPRFVPQVIAMSGVTDPYQPVEQKLEITRSCLEVLREFRCPVSLITKNALVTRDIDILREMAEWGGAGVMISLPTMEPNVARVMEPRASIPQRRLQAMRELSEAGIPVGVMVAPIIPGLTDHEVISILQAAAEHGASIAGYTTVRLPYGLKDLFADWLGQHFPGRQEKVLRRIREMRGGKLNQSDFGRRFATEGPFAAYISSLFRITCKKLGLGRRFPQLSTEHFIRPGEQLTLF